MTNRLPKTFIEKLDFYFPQYLNRILKGLSISKKTTFRINRIKIDRQGFYAKARLEQIKVQGVCWYDDAFVLISPDQRQLQQSSLYTSGEIYLQNLSSMLPVLFLDLKEGKRILDLCAAPGSKTTQIASILKNQCELVAVEKIKPRFYKLKANLTLQGVDCVRLYLLDARKITKFYVDYFDSVLVDVPCSAEGRFNIFQEKSYAYWSPRKVKEMQHKQKRIITAAYYATKPGGSIVYSTCTFSPEENEFLIEWALKKFSGLKLEPINLPIKNVFCGINKIGWHIIPDQLMEGFYICKLKKCE